jgi:hypothetical protein
MKKKKQEFKPQEYIVFSEKGYFCGLAFGGEPQWSMNVNDAKPLNDVRKFCTLQSISHGLEMLIEII